MQDFLEKAHFVPSSLTTWPPEIMRYLIGQIQPKP